MANMNVRARLAKIQREITDVRKYIAQYHGVPKGTEALMVDNDCGTIIQQAAEIAAMARTALGDRSSDKLVRNIRKALGFTYP